MAAMQIAFAGLVYLARRTVPRGVYVAPFLFDFSSTKTILSLREHDISACVLGAPREKFTNGFDFRLEFRERTILRTV